MLGFRSRPKKFLGIDIGISCVRVVEIGKEKNGFVLENYGEIETASLFAENSDETARNSGEIFSRPSRELAEIIKMICQEADIKITDANFSIPDFFTFFTAFQIPVMDKKEIAEAVQLEVRPYIPLPLSEITLDWVIIHGEPAKTPLKILAVAIPNKIVSQYEEIAAASGLKIKSLEPEVFALTRTAARISKDKKGIIGLIDIGSRSTTCSVSENETLKISHSFSIAGRQLTERLSRTLNISYQEAEEIKKKQGLLTNGDGVNGAGKILVPLVDSILEEIKKVFREYYQNEGKEVEKVFLLGGSALMPGIKEHFAESLQKEVSVLDPFSSISHAPILSESLKNKGPLYAVAIGLAIKGLE